MENSFRYKMQHVGDFVVGYLDKGCGAVKSRTLGVTITYKIHDLNKKRQKLCTKIGDRLAEIRKTSPEETVFEDEKMLKLFAKLKGIDDRIEARKKEREERLYSAEFSSEET
jgi:hypothetical protein